MKQIGIGVIGWGFMGRTHTFSIKTMPLHYNLDFEPRLIGICSRRLEKAEQAAREQGFKYAADDYHKLLADPETHIEVASLSGRPPRLLSKQVLAGVIEPRVEEIFSLVQKEVQASGFEHLVSSGVVITGGSAMMPGMVELGEDIFLKPVRIGTPNYDGALADMVTQARASVVMGMLEDARQTLQRGGYPASRKSDSTVKGWFGRIRDFIVGNF